MHTSVGQNQFKYETPFIAISYSLNITILTEKKVKMIYLLTNALSWLWLLYLLYWNPLFELSKLQSSLIDSKAFSVPIIAGL